MRSAVVVPALSLFVFACSETKPPQVTPDKALVLTILGTADTHGRLEALPLFSAYVDAVRAKEGERSVVLVDAGDAFQGTLESDADEGQSMIAAYNAVRFDAMAVGNHEFDYGPEGPPTTTRNAPGGDKRGALKRRALEAKFPILAANVACKGDAACGIAFLGETMLDKIVKVGVIGVTTEATLHTTIAANVDDLRMLPITKTVIERAAALRAKGAQVIIVAAHAGGRCKKFVTEDSLKTCDSDAEIFQVARALPKGTVDVIVAGHTHQGVAHVVNGVAIVQSFSHLRSFGRVDLFLDPKTKQVLHTNVRPPESMKDGERYEGVAMVPSVAVQATIAPALARAEEQKRQPLGPFLTRSLERRYGEESALGNFVASQMLALSPEADVALMNGGGIRADLPAGALTYGALYQTLPFDNRVALVRLSGKDVRSVFARNLKNDNGILSVAGANIEASCVSGALSVRVFLERKGKDLTDDDTVLVITNDFLATGGDDAWKGGEVIIQEDAPPIREAIAARLRSQRDQIMPDAWYDRSRPRILKPSPRPVLCSH